MTIATSKTEALAEHIGGIDSSDLTKENFDHYGLSVYSVNGEEWAIGTDSEADEACKEYVKDTAWAFRSSFICEYCNLPQELAEALEAMQSKKCEGANDSILALIDKTDGGLDGFVEEAVSADGRGHFLSGYDGEECEVGEFFAYRIN
jgi:hypothetical protein